MPIHRFLREKLPILWHNARLNYYARKIQGPFGGRRNNTFLASRARRVHRHIGLGRGGGRHCRTDDGGGNASAGAAGSGGGKAYLGIRLADGTDGSAQNDTDSAAEISRTLLPTEAPAVNTLGSIVLTGSFCGGEVVPLASWDNTAQMAEALIPLDSGEWNFTLTAKSAGGTDWLSNVTATLAQEKKNLIPFTLYPLGGTGSVRIAITAPSGSGAVYATADIYMPDGTTSMGKASSGALSGNSWTYSASGIPAGTYIARFALYSDTGGLYKIATYSDVVVVRGDCVTTGSLAPTAATSYILTLNANSGSFSGAATKTVDVPVSKTLQTASAMSLAKTGWTFRGWMKGGASGASADVLDGGLAVLDRDSTYWALWEANKYKVRFNRNQTSSDSTKMTQTLTYDSTQALTTLSSLGWTRSDAAFVGWATSSTGTSIATSAGGTVSLTNGASGKHNLTATANATVDLYSIWKYTITYDGNKGSSPTDVTGSVQSQDVTGWNTGLTLQSNGYSHTGYTFGGWNTASGGGGTDYTAGGSYKFTANTTLYAKWSPISYDITYNMNNGTNSSSNPSTYTVEDSVSLSDPQSRTGYTFNGWFTNSNFATAGSTIARGSTGAKSFWAKWTANTYTVTLNANGGSGGSSSVTATYDSAMPSITLPTRTGYKFAGFYDSSSTSGGTQYYTAAGASAKNYTTAGGTTLYARWNIIKPKITIKTGWAKSVTTTQTVTATYGQALPSFSSTNSPSNHTLGEFERLGYDLQGFYSAENGGGTKFYNADGTSAYGNCDFESDKTIYAYWKLKTGCTALSGSSSGKSLSAGTYVVSSDLSFTNSTAGGSGITVSGTANIYIEEGCTITATGSDGSSGSGGGAGIEVASGKTLNLYGYGSVVATGGKGGAAEAGKSNAKDAYMKGSFDSIKSGTGGAGGKGAGGGGAGIGTKGGSGGAGGAAGTQLSYGNLSWRWYWAGKNGGNGSSGTAGATCGTIKKQSGITISATGGAGGDKGNGGTCYTSTTTSDKSGQSNYRMQYKVTNYWTCGAGGAGGGGGGGYAGADIGTGGAGGGGGGGGGSGTIAADDEYIFQGGQGGTGGSGSTAGGKGNDDNPLATWKSSDPDDSNGGRLTGYGGSGGAAGGGAGTAKTVGSL